LNVKVIITNVEFDYPKTLKIPEVILTSADQ
jgi:hypothetical protein